MLAVLHRLLWCSILAASAAAFAGLQLQQHVSRSLMSSRSALCLATSDDEQQPDSSDAAENRLFIFGLGYVGSVVAAAALAQGYSVAGTTRSSTRHALWKQEGASPFEFDGQNPLCAEGVATLAAATHVLITAPPSSEGVDPVLLQHSEQLRSSQQLQWIGYCSSTGVYGDAQGEWVTEATEPTPVALKAQARLQAEQQWRALASSVKALSVLRLAGIYGPGRNAMTTLQRKAGDLLACGAADNSTMISRIHVVDTARLVVHAFMARPQSGLLVLNVADTLPATRYETFSLAAELLGYPQLAVEQIDSGSYVSSRGGGSKRVDSSRMAELLQQCDLQYAFPDYTAGLQDVADQRAFRLSNLQQAEV
jgi:nucleoside-diphosphate-sugar epimerase